MPERSFSTANGYRYGFNGKENDNEVKGIEGSQQDYGYRVYDPRLGKFLSVDPLCAKFPWWSPYHFAGNTPIQAVDQDGLETSFDNVQHANDLARLHVSSSSDNRKAYNKGVVMGMAAGTALFAAVVTGSAAIPYILQYGSKVVIAVAPYATTTTYLASQYGKEGAGLVAGACGYDGDIPGTEGDEFGKWINKGVVIGAEKIGGKLTKYAFGVDGFAQKLAGMIGGEHLMSFKGNWMAEFKRLAAQKDVEMHFDLTDVTLSENLTFKEFSSFLANPVSNTQKELSVLYNEFNAKFKETIFSL